MEAEKAEKKKQENDTGYRVVDTQLYLGMLRELIEEGKDVSVTVTGGSMTPFLIHRRDSVILSPAGNVRRGDVVLYRRDCGTYVLHRIIRRAADGTYVLCGDAQTLVEKGVRRDQIFAVVTAVRRKGELKEPGCFFWFFFARIWICLIPLRQVILKTYSFFRPGGSGSMGENNGY